MTIYIDADACPVTRIAESIAKVYFIPVVLLCDTNHVLTSEYSTVKVVGAGNDAVDIALINLCHQGDIVITQDYGVAAMALGKGARAIHQSGRWYTDGNIETLLMERHIAKKARLSGKRHLKGPAKRTPEDDRRFAESFERMICEAVEYTCKIATREEMERKWDDEISRHDADRALWSIWKREAIQNAENGSSIPYYGLMQGIIICEATAVISLNSEQADENLAGARTAYLCALRTVPEYQGKGFMSRLMDFMLDDLRKRGYERATLGVEPSEDKNRQIYRHWGFTEYMKSAQETYPDGTVIDVLYYGKEL